MKFTYIKVDYAFVSISVCLKTSKKMEILATEETFYIVPLKAIEKCLDSIKQKIPTLPPKTFISTYQAFSFITDKKVEDFKKVSFEELKWEIPLLDEITSIPPANFISKIEAECKERKINFNMPDNLISVTTPKYLFQKNIFNPAKMLTSVIDYDAIKELTKVCEMHELDLVKITPLDIAAFGIPIKNLQKTAVLETHTGNFVVTIFLEGKIKSKEYFPIENNSISEEIINFCIEKNCTDIVTVLDSSKFNIPSIETKIAEMGANVKRISRLFSDNPYLVTITEHLSEKRDRKLGHKIPSYQKSIFTPKNLLRFIRHPASQVIVAIILVIDLSYKIVQQNSISKEAKKISIEYNNPPKNLQKINRIEKIKTSHLQKTGEIKNEIKSLKQKSSYLKKFDTNKLTDYFKYSFIIAFKNSLYLKNLSLSLERFSATVVSKQVKAVSRYQGALEKILKENLEFSPAKQSKQEFTLLARKKEGPENAK